jgi:hypothetical protein
MKHTVIGKGKNARVLIPAVKSDFSYVHIKNMTFKEFDAEFRGRIEYVKEVYETIINANVENDEVIEVVEEAKPEKKIKKKK